MQNNEKKVCMSCKIICKSHTANILIHAKIMNQIENHIVGLDFFNMYINTNKNNICSLCYHVFEPSKSQLKPCCPPVFIFYFLYYQGGKTL